MTLNIFTFKIFVLWKYSKGFTERKWFSQQSSRDGSVQSCYTQKTRGEPSSHLRPAYTTAGGLSGFYDRSAKKGEIKLHKHNEMILNIKNLNATTYWDKWDIHFNS